MQNYQARIRYTEEQETQVMVSSSKCTYQVWIEDEVTLVGPGVHESASFENLQQIDDVEDFAILIVLLFENGLWPTED